MATSTQNAMNQRYAQLFQTTKDQRSCDVTFVIGALRIQYPVNRMIMASLSNVFKAMLHGKMKESQPNAQVVIVDVSPNAFECALKFAYCNDPKMCDKYRITALTNLCRIYLDNCVDRHNICMLLNDLAKHKLRWISAQFRSVGNHADTIVQSLAFRQMTLDAMKVFLSWDSLSIQESVLWNAVVKWAEYQATKITEPPTKKSRMNNAVNKNVDEKKMKNY